MCSDFGPGLSPYRAQLKNECIHKNEPSNIGLILNHLIPSSKVIKVLIVHFVHDKIWGTLRK